MRSGVIAQKVGMTRIFTDAGEHIPVTVLKLENCQVVGHRTPEKNGYTAVQLGAGTPKVKSAEPRRARPFRRGQGRAEAEARRVPRQPRQSDRGRRRDHRRPFRRGPVRRRLRHHDRQGLCRRHEAARNFGGLRASHGVSVSHRSHGSTGQRQDPGKVFKGKKMAGHMGDVRVTTQNLRGGADRCRARADHGPRRGAGRQGRLGDDPRRGQAGAAGDRAEAGRLPQARRRCVGGSEARDAERRKRAGRGWERSVMKADVITLDAKTAGTVELRRRSFGLEPRDDILHRMVRWQLAKRRAGTHIRQGSRRDQSYRRRSSTGRRAPAAPVTAAARRRFPRRRQGVRADSRAATPSTCRRRCGRSR